MEATNSAVVSSNSQHSTNSTPAHKITEVFERTKREKRGVLIPYFMCGYPTAIQSVEIILAAARGGADIIELGMPFSDPLADGATVQHAGQIALEQGMTMKGCLEVAHQVSTRSDVPLLLMGYYNPILAYGIERFCEAARANGVSGLIIPDLPAQEADPLQEAAYRNGLSLVFLIPPTTPDARIADVAQRTAAGPGSFIYCVSLSGVTGSRNELPPHLQSFIQRVRRFTSDKHIPLAVGFGLSKPEHIAVVTRLVEGAVVGSALVNVIEQNEDGDQVEAVASYIRSLTQK